MIKYSFVLPAYKARFFREAVDSILAQTYKDFELVIVNDSSPEDLETIVNSYDDRRIRYYVNEVNIGGKNLVAQWNHCLEYAKGEYVILASDDDVYSPEYLERMNELVDKYPSVNVFRPRVKRIDENGNILHLDGYISEYLSKVEFLYFWSSCLIGSGIPFYIFKRDALMSIGGFVDYPLAWFSDDATVFLLSDDGVVTCNNTLFSFRQSGLNISTSENTKASLDGSHKHFGIEEVLCPCAEHGIDFDRLCILGILCPHGLYHLDDVYLALARFCLFDKVYGRGGEHCLYPICKLGRCGRR